MSGISLSLDDLLIPDSKKVVIDRADKEVDHIEKLYRDGVITNGERYSKVISTWGHATADMANEAYNELEKQNTIAYENKNESFKPFNPVFMMLDSGARGSKDQIKQLVGMRGPMATPGGGIVETPVKSNFKEGLSVFEYFISTHGARKGQSDTALKTANSGYLTRRLVDVAQDVVITTDDCKTLGYVEIRDLKESGDVVFPLAKRVFGRVLASDVKDMVSGKTILKQGDVIDRDTVEHLSRAVVSSVLVRSVLSCQAKRGICAVCYGYDLSRGDMVDVGTTVGTIAAQSIGEPGTQLTMKTFHIGGTASGIAARPYLSARYDGTVEWRGIRVIKNRHGQWINISRKSSLVILSKDRRELQEHDIEYGSIIYIEDQQEVKIGTKLVEWDPTSKVIVTEQSGTVKFVDLIDNITVQERFDDATNKSSLIVLEHKDEKQPALSIIDQHGVEVAHYYLPAGSYLSVTKNQKVETGDMLVKMPREVLKTKDIATGLPRIAELFEARMPKDQAIMSDIDGEVVFGELHRGMRKVSVVSGTESFDYSIPRGKQMNVMNGDIVSAGDLLTTGTPALHDMLRVLGPDHVQRYLVDQIQEIYRLQGIDINDKHIELIVRQMMRKVRITDSGDTDFLIGDRVDRIHFMTVNVLLKAEGKKVARAKPVLMGITQASLGTESFISAASFQETTRILSDAAIAGQIDHLYGLKENVIVGKLIPAGTGVASFRKKYLGAELSDVERQAQQEEQQEIGLSQDEVKSMAEGA